MIFFRKAQITCALSRLVRSSLVYNTPCKRVVGVCVLECPYKIGQFCLVTVFAMFQGRLMQRVSRLEGVFCHANVVLSVVPMLYSGFVYDVAL